MYDVSRRLREHRWLVPACTFPPHRQDLAACRVVCRNGFSSGLAGMLRGDLARLLPELRQQPYPMVRDRQAETAFHHSERH